MSAKKIALVIFSILVLSLAGLYLFLETYDFNKLKPVIVQLVKESIGRDLEIKGDLDFKLGFGPVIVARGVSLSNADWGSRPEMAGMERVEIRAALFPLIRGDLVMANLLLIKPDILVEINESGETNLPQTAANGDDRPAEKTFRLPLKKVEFRDGQFIYQDSRSGKSYRFEIDKLTASAGGMARPVQILFKGVYKDHPFRMAGRFGSLTSLTRATEKWPIDLGLEYNDIKLAMKGSLDDVMGLRKLALDLNLEGLELQSLSDLIEIKMPFSGEFAVSGRLTDSSPLAYQVSGFTLKLGENRLQGSLGLDLSSEKPHFTAAITAQEIDLGPLWPAREEKKAKAGRQQGKLFSREPLPLDFLEKVEGRVLLSVETLFTPFLIATDVHLKAGLSRGHLNLEPIQARVGSGSLMAGLKIESQKEVYRLESDLKLADISLSELQQEWPESGSLSGNVNGDLSLAGYGHSLASIMAGLKGGVDLRMNNGLIANKYFQHLNVFGRDFVSNVFRLLNPVREENEYTRIICSVCRLDIDNGISQITALVVNTPQMVVVGEGRVNLMTERLDISLKPSPKEGIGIEGLPRISLSLRDLARPFKLGGTLANPSLSLDPTQAALTIGKALGGTVLFGPVGIAAVLLGGVADSEEDPCLAAIEAAEKAARLKEGEKQKPEKNILEKAGEKVKGLFKGRR